MQIVHFKWKCESSISSGNASFIPFSIVYRLRFHLIPCDLVSPIFFIFCLWHSVQPPLSFLSFFTLFISLITLIYQNHQLQWFAVLPFYSHLSWLITMKFFVKSSYLLLFSSRCYLKRSKKRNSQMSLFIIGRIKYYICSFRLWTDSSELFVHSKHRGRSFHCIS